MDGQAKKEQLLTRALAEFSAACEAPALTPICPFYQLMGGRASCGEECMDILAARGGNPQVSLVARLGPELAIAKLRHPRSRRAPDNLETHPFDAARIQRLDNDVPTRDKRTVSLVRDLLDAVLTPLHMSDDPEDRAYRISACWDELERRGFSLQPVIRGVVAPSMAGMVCVIASLNTEDEDLMAAMPVVATWREYMQNAHRHDVDAQEASFEAFLFRGRAMNRLVKWFEEASRETIAQWALPTLEHFTELPTSYVEHAAARLGRWQFDRFANTYLSDWRDESLALEWKYLHGEGPGCASPAVMKERWIDPADLSRALAGKSISLILKDAEQASTQQLRTSSFTRVAASYLEQGRFEDAAQIFRAILEVDPSDCVAHNHLGFCLMPIEFKAALKELDLAADRGAASDTVNSLNRALVHHLLGNDEEALRLADIAAATDKLAEPTAWLWGHDAQGKLRLGSFDVREYAEGIILHINEAQCKPSEIRLPFEP